MENEKAKSKKREAQEKQRKAKKPIVVKVKRKRDETPEEALVIQQRITKKTKVNFIDSFKNMNLGEGSTPSNQEDAVYTTSMSCYSFPYPNITDKYFRYFGTGTSSNFDVNAKLKEAQNPSLPHIYTMQQV
jgi:hypothetical protein